jgi:riboflavin synthase
MVFDGASIGASVSIDGVCLTVTGRDGANLPEPVIGGAEVSNTPDALFPDIFPIVYFDIGERTAALTTLGHIGAGDVVHVERSYRAGEENGGHALYGHVDSTARLVARRIHGAEPPFEVATSATNALSLNRLTQRSQAWTSTSFRAWADC